MYAGYVQASVTDEGLSQWPRGAPAVAPAEMTNVIKVHIFRGIFYRPAQTCPDTERGLRTKVGVPSGNPGLAGIPTVQSTDSCNNQQMALQSQGVSTNGIK